MIPLDSLKPGEEAIIRSFARNSAANNYLMELGLMVETPVKLIKFAPMGDPIEICFRNHHLSIRRSEAKSIFVEKVKDKNNGRVNSD